MQDTTNQSGLPVNQKRALFSLKKALTLSSFASAIQTWQLKRISRDVEKTLERVIRAKQQKINSVPAIGHAKLGEETMKIEEVIGRLEKHEAECNLRYQRIEEKLEDQKKSLEKLDYKIWGLAILILLTPIIHKLWGV